MKRSSILTLVLIITLILSACGARGAQATPPPTIDALELQKTVAAAAFTMLAQTQTALPTATLTATPTDTPVPTITLPPLPTLDATFTAVPNANSGGGDPCINAVLPATLVGNPVKIRINNTTKAAVSFTIYLNQTTPQGKCGYRAYKIDPGQALVLNDLVEGCVTLWAWNPDPEEYFIVTNGAATCLNDSFDTWVFDISTSSIKLRT
jgi:hypothetical protein